MIIQALKAKNILKYSSLELSELPMKGMIAISGENESGKTAIIETICFALFGRTFLLDVHDIALIIRWGETNGVVELTFEGPEGKSYILTRQIHSDGSQGARLTYKDSGELVATGPSAVEEAVSRLCVFDFQGFIDTIYLGQSEVGAIHSKALTGKLITGVKVLESTAIELEREIGEAQTAINESEVTISEVSGQIDSLNIEEARLSYLENDRNEAEQSIRKTQQNIIELQSNSKEIGKAIDDVQNKVEQFNGIGRTYSLNEWQQHAHDINESIENLESSNKMQDETGDINSNLKELKGFKDGLQNPLKNFRSLLEKAATYRENLVHLLSEKEGEHKIQEEPIPIQLNKLSTMIDKLLKRCGLLRFITLSILILAIMVLGIWSVTMLMPNQPFSQTISQWITTILPDWGPQQIGKWLLGFVGVLIALSLLFYILMKSKSKKMQQLQADKVELEDRMNRLKDQMESLQDFETIPVASLFDLMEQAEDVKLTDETSRFRPGDGKLLDSEDTLETYKKELKNTVENCKKAVHIEQSKAEVKQKTMMKEQDDQSTQLKGIEEEIDMEKERLKQENELNGVLQQLRFKIERNKHDIIVRQMSLELIEGASREALEIFNKDLQIFMSRVTPKLTNMHYNYLQIDSDLNIKVFSSEKHDFIGWNEISTGTQQQILLSLRLALTAALAESSKEQSAQCIILDEPFAYYDAKRMHDSLEALPKASKNISQIWVIAQDFPSDVKFDLHIQCNQSNNKITVKTV